MNSAAFPPFDLRQLRQFAVLAEELHYGRAAARLAMTQPPLTQAIQRLEGALGVVLFERSPRRVRLSPAGEALLPLARRLLDEAATVAAAVRAASEGSTGRLRLAFVSSVAYGPLPGWLSGFRAQSPGVVLALREATQDVQLELFAAGEIDAGLMVHAPGAAPAGFDAVRVVDEALVLAVPEGHRLLARAPAAAARDGLARLRWREVAGEPLVIFPRHISPSLFDALAAAGRASGHEMRIAQQAIQMQTIVNLVSGGMGVAWVPESVTQFRRPGVRYARVTGAPAGALQCETSLVRRPGAPPVVERFVGHVTASVRRAARRRGGG
jgi:DNA-binding transcriptional LysR family regulator